MSTLLTILLAWTLCSLALALPAGALVRGRVHPVGPVPAPVVRRPARAVARAPIGTRTAPVPLRP